MSKINFKIQLFFLENDNIKVLIVTVFGEKYSIKHTTILITEVIFSSSFRFDQEYNDYVF